jgi:3-methyladenine DNA glycosylase AlkD
VKKGVNWALRSLGNRGPVLKAAAIELATRLSREKAPAPRWVGTDALRQLAKRAARAEEKAKAKVARSPALKASPTLARLKPDPVTRSPKTARR